MALAGVGPFAPFVVNGPRVPVEFVVVTHVSTPVAWSKLHPAGTGGPSAKAGVPLVTSKAPAPASAAKTGRMFMRWLPLLLSTRTV